MASTAIDPDEMTYAAWRAAQPPVLTVRTLRANHYITQVCMTVITWGLWIPFIPVKQLLWTNNCLDIYPDRIVRRLGTWHRESETIKINRVTNIRVERHAGWPDRGFIEIESAGRHSALRFGLIANPEHVRDLILSYT